MMKMKNEEMGSDSMDSNESNESGQTPLQDVIDKIDGMISDQKLLTVDNLKGIKSDLEGISGEVDSEYMDKGTEDSGDGEDHKMPSIMIAFGKLKKGSKGENK